MILVGFPRRPISSGSTRVLCRAGTSDSAALSPRTYEALAASIDAADAYVFVTPGYYFWPPTSLLNAVNYADQQRFDARSMPSRNVRFCSVIATNIRSVGGKH